MTKHYVDLNKPYVNRIAELEDCFKKYPDVPKEVIIKEDCIRHGLAFTSAALDACEGYQVKSYFLFQADRSSRASMKQGEALRAPEHIKICGGDYKLRDTVVGNHIGVDSPYVVDVIEGKLKLCDRSEEGITRPVADVKLRRPPRYYNLTFEDGRRYSEIGPAPCWAYQMFLTIFRHCQYWGDKEECKFCDMNADVKERPQFERPYVVHKKVKDVVKVVEAAFSDYVRGEPPTDPGEFESVWEMGPHAVMISGGTISHQVGGLDDTEFYLQYVEPIREKLPSRFPLILQTAAKDKKTCKRIKEAGVDVVCFNFEVWDKRLFQILCPGKETFVGHDEWIKRTCEAVDVFGETGVHPGFVAGVEMAQPWGFKTVDEAVKSTTEGFDFLMAHGVTPRPITWFIEPLSALAGHPMTPLDYYVRIYRNWYELWTKYGLQLINGYGPFETGRGRYQDGAYVDMGPVVY